MPWDTTVLVYPPDGSGAGTDISCLVDSVTVHHGRDDSGSQPEASSVGLDFTVTPEDPLPPIVEIGSVLITRQATHTLTSTRFSGRITDLALGWDEAGAETPDAGVGQLTAVGYLADTGRRVIGDAPYPQELDGDRVQRVMTAAGFPLDPAYSDPGTVQILPRDIDAQPALGVAQGVAQSGSGIVWETKEGAIRYADAMHRKNAPVALTLDACDILVTPTWRRTLEGLINDVSIGYGVAPEGGEAPRYTATEPNSMARFGHYAYAATTELAALADAQALGQMLLVRNSSPVWVMAALPVDTAGLDAARYDALLGLEMHSLIVLTGLPAIGAAPTSSATLRVEGWKETLTYQGHEIELVVSGYCRTAPAPRWNDVSPEWLWGGQALTEKRRNLSVTPTAASGVPGWSPNNGANHATVLGVPITGHPNGITTACQVTVTGAAGTATAASQYNVDGLGNSATVRGGGVWVLPPYPCNVSVSTSAGTAKTTAAPAGVWTYCTTLAPGTGYMVVGVSRTNGVTVAGDVVKMTGSIAETGKVPPSYFDGSTPDTANTDYAWAGTPNASASVQSAIAPIAGGVDPSLTWDGATCLGPPINYGRWNDQPATLRWDMVPATTTWDTFTGL